MVLQVLLTEMKLADIKLFNIYCMQVNAKTPEEYIENIPDNRKQAVSALRKIILENLPEGFTEVIGYGMIGYVKIKDSVMQ